jgi:hypothetical protein
MIHRRRNGKEKEHKRKNAERQRRYEPKKRTFYEISSSKIAVQYSSSQKESSQANLKSSN